MRVPAQVGGRGQAWSVWKHLRSVARADLLSLAALLLGWLALLTWFGPGADGWQARFCATLNQPSGFCAAGHGPAKFTLRVAS